MGDPPFEYGAPRQDWSIEDIEWDPTEVRAELRTARSVDPDASASSAAQAVASSSGPTNESGGDVPVVLDTFQSAGTTKRRVPMQCQVDGCNKDLSVEKEYYQRYRICEEHLKLSSLLKDGVQQRFCQQCGRFHLLAEFDGDKRSCRARLDLHNNRRRKRGEAGDGSFRSSARLERRLGDALHSRVSPRTRARRTTSRSRRSPALSTTDDEMTEDNSEVEQATRPRQRQSVAAAAAEEEAGTPTTRERRYATRQATAAAQRKPHSYNPALDFEKLYPPSIAETLAALQRGAGPAEPPPPPVPSHMSLREELAIGGSSLDASTRGMLAAGGRQRLVAEQMLRHLSDPGQVREHLRQHSDTGLNLARNMLLVNSLSSPTYLPSSMDRVRSESSAEQASLEQEFHESLRAHSSELYQQQGAAPQLPYGGPFSEALGAAGLSHYAAQLLYKCASDPTVQDTFGRPNLPPAAIAGVHLAPGAAGGGGAAGSAGGGAGEQRIISYSSEPTSGSTSGLAKFPSEPFIRPRSVYPQYSAFDLSPGEFHDVAWPGPPQAPSVEPKQEQLSLRQGPTKRFFESAEGSSQGSRGKGRASQQQQQQQQMGSMEAAGQAPSRSLPFTMPGLPSSLSFAMAPLAGLAHSSGGGASGSGGGLSRLPSAEEVQASMQREHSTERHMGRISLASSLDILQQRMTSDRQALLAGERSASGGDAPRRSTDGGPQPGAALLRSSSQRLPSGFMERIPEHAATIEAPLTAQDLLPAARPGSALLSDIFTAYNFQSARGGAGGFGASGAHREPAAEGSSQYAGFQGLRDASLQPWHQVASPSRAGLAPLVGTPGPPARGGNGGQPEGSAWAASLFASPSSTAMSSTPSKDGTSPSAWLSPLLQQVAGGSATAPVCTSSEVAATGPMDTAQLLSTWRADSGASFSTLPLPRASIAAAPTRSDPAEAERTRTPPPSEPSSAERPAAPLGTPPADMPPERAAIAQAAWPPLAAADDACSPCSSPTGAGAQHVRVSTKLESAGAEDIAGRALRSDLEDILGGEGNVPRLEAAVRPGCVHLVVDALVLQTCQADSLDAVKKTAVALAERDPLWRRGRVLLQTANAAALLQDGVVCGVWIGEDLKRQVPEMPCAAPFAAAVPGSLALRLHRSFFHCPRAGLRCAAPRRLLARCRGRFLADIDLAGMQAVHTKDVRVELGAAGGPGLAWLEAECDGFMSAPLPVVLSPDPDIVEEIRVLEPDVAAGRRPWEATSALLADVGLILEYAAALGVAGHQPSRKAELALQDSKCMQHVARLAQRRLPDFCELGWPALTAQALPVAAVGCTSLRQLLSETAGLAEGAGTLLHAAVRSESISMVSLLLDLGRYGFKWDLRARAEPGAQTALHLAANMDDEGRMAGLLLHHPSCPEAGMLWSILKNAAGQTPADIAFSAAKARPGRIFLLLSPAERASIGSYYSAPEYGSSVDADDELTPESSITPSTESALSRQASNSVEEASFRRGVTPLSRADCLPATPFLDVSLPLPQPLPPRQQKEDAGADSAPEEGPHMRSVESAPLASGELSSMASCILHDDRIIRKSFSADADSHAGREQLRAALLLPPLARAVHALRSTGPTGPAEPPRQSLDGVRAALRIGSETDLYGSPSMEDLRRLRRAIAAFPDAPSASAADGRPAEMQRLSVVMHDLGAVRCASANAVRNYPEEYSADDLPICLSAPSVIPAGCSQGLLPAPMDELSANKTRSEVPTAHQPHALLEGSTPIAHTAAAAMPLDCSLQADSPGRVGKRRAEKVRARQVALVLLMLGSCLVLPRAAFLCMLASATVFLLCSPSFQEVWASFPSCAGQDVRIDKLEAQVTYLGWRRHLLCFSNADLERDFLHFFAGARYQLDVLFSVLFTVLSLLLLCSGAPHLPSPAAGPWLVHALFAALPAALALNKRSWYLRHREVVMMVARIGCQLAAIFCSATSQGGSAAPSHWTTALIGEVLAAALQLLHLPIGFQIRTLLHLPLTLLALRLRLRVRPQPSWPQAAAVCALTLLPTHVVATLERRARRCFLASLPSHPVSAGVPPRRGG